MKKRVRAISIEIISTPEKPNAPAIMARIKKVIINDNIKELL